MDSAIIFLVKKLFRSFVVETSALYAVSNIASGLVFTRGTETIIFSGIALTLASLVVKPIINLLLLPINLLTFNLFKWVSSAVALYLTTLAVTDFKITQFYFPGYESLGIQNFTLEGLGALIAFSFLISLITSFVNWLIS